MALERWLDCKYEKILLLNPKINQTLLLLNRWGIEAHIDSNGIKLNYDKEEETFQKLLDFYHITCFENDGVEAINSSTPVILPCDLYYMPYAKEYYRKKHGIHYIVIEKKCLNGDWIVFDDNPQWHDTLSSEILLQAYTEVQLLANESLKGERYVCLDNDSIKTKEEEWLFICDNVTSPCLSDFLMEILDRDDSIVSRVKDISKLFLQCKKLYALPIFCNRIRVYLNIIKNIEQLELTAFEYAEQWTILTGLSFHYLQREYQINWTRIENRIFAIRELEKQIAELMIP